MDKEDLDIIKDILQDLDEEEPLLSVAIKDERTNDGKETND